MSFVAECVQDSMPIWEQCLASDFLKSMEDGTLPEDRFAGYIVDDSLYLREYAKVFACGLVKSRTLEEIRTYYSFLAFVNEGEGNTRVEYLKKLGISEEILETLPQRPENRAYTDFMLQATQEGTTGVECMMAGLPCMLSYVWIFRTMAERTPAVLDGPYGTMVRDYLADSCERDCVRWSIFADKISAGLTAEEKAQCMAIFRQSSLHELNFWRMSNAPREDLGTVI